MSLDNTKNFAKVTVSTGYASTDTSIVLSSGNGAKLPTAPFNATWWNSTDYADPSDDPNVEIVRVTAISTDTLTVTRGQEGIAASTKNTAGKTYKMIAGITAKVINTDIPALIPAAITSRMRATMSASQILGATAVIQFNTKDYDNLSEFNTTTYTFTATNAGYYYIHAHAEIGASSLTTTQAAQLFVAKNATNQVQWSATGYVINNVAGPMDITTILSLAANDAITIKGYAQANVTVGSGTTNNSYLEIIRLQ